MRANYFFTLVLVALTVVTYGQSTLKTDVWDFGATELDTMLYNNQLTEEIINSWYDPGIEVGTIGNVLPSGWTVDRLGWIGGGNDRLRSNNTNLTRYDFSVSNGLGYRGRIYVNSAANVDRYLHLTLEADDEVTIVTKTDSGGEIHFQYEADPAAQTDIVEVGTDVVEATFTAGEAGVYRIFDVEGKPSYYRVYRKPAVYSEVTGAVDTTAAPGIPADFGLVFTNTAGKDYHASLAAESYTVDLPVGDTYGVRLAGANGYIITSATTLEVTEEMTDFAVTIEQVELYTVSGTVMGLSGELLTALELVYTPDPAAGAIYVPVPAVDAASGAYTVDLEPNLEYTISAIGVNDYFIPDNTLSIGTADETADVTFSPKPVYNITIDAQGLSTAQVAALSVTFTNLNEVEYIYTFEDVEAVMLRDGIYAVSVGGLDAYPLELGLTSNLSVMGSATEKVLNFNPVTYWPFDDRVIENGDPTYKGLLFTGQVQNEIVKSHLAASAGSTVQVPCNPGERVIIDYYYTADFSIDGGEAIMTNTLSTSILERVTYDYPGTEAGYTRLQMGAGVGTTYLTDISIFSPYPYTETLTVGEDKDFQTVNGALDAVRRMDRPEDERVCILIDPGNYEEMLVIDENNITLKNASSMPSIGLLNQGIDIEPEAVRITSYYGTGYHYYSMDDQQKWDADVLRVSTENGFLSNENAGDGTTNGSFWNATVVVYANGFEAEHIIFENSFNQYISRKEAEDTVIPWEVASPGARPTNYGNTLVQDRNLRERAAAIAFANDADKAILYKCKVIGRQDSFFGGHGARVVMYKGAALGAVDYIFGGMTAVFYQTELTMNTDDNSIDRSYLTAAQQRGERGYLMNRCIVNSTVPGVETASQYGAKPGYFGRPWEANTSEVVFYRTTIETSTFPGEEGNSLIEPVGWTSSLGGESTMMYEYGTEEESGVDNSGFRANWSTVLTDPVLTDGTAITNFNFTRGNDGWDPLPGLIESDPVGIKEVTPVTAVQVRSYGKRIFISNVESDTQVDIYGLDGVHLRSLQTRGDIDFPFHNGFWIIAVKAADGEKAVKVFLED